MSETFRLEILLSDPHAKKKRFQAAAFVVDGEDREGKVAGGLASVPFLSAAQRQRIAGAVSEGLGSYCLEFEDGTAVSLVKNTPKISSGEFGELSYFLPVSHATLRESFRIIEVLRAVVKEK